MATAVTRPDFSAKRAEGFNRIPLARLDEIEARLISAHARLSNIKLDPSVDDFDARTIFYLTTQSAYEAWVETIREYIFEGEVMQVVPSQRLSLPLKSLPLSLCRALRDMNPSLYMYFLDLDGFEDRLTS